MEEDKDDEAKNFYSFGKTWNEVMGD